MMMLSRGYVARGNFGATGQAARGSCVPAFCLTKPLLRLSLSPLLFHAFALERMSHTLSLLFKNSSTTTTTLLGIFFIQGFTRIDHRICIWFLLFFKSCGHKIKHMSQWIYLSSKLQKKECRWSLFFFFINYFRKIVFSRRIFAKVIRVNFYQKNSIFMINK